MSTALEQAGELRSLGDRPLAVVTAPEGAQDGWRALQDELATLSSNSVHRVVPGATHASLIADTADAAESSDAIRDVVESVRAASPIAQLLLFLTCASQPSGEGDPACESRPLGQRVPRGTRAAPRP
jgi:hypothetical protein